MFGVLLFGMVVGLVPRMSHAALDTPQILAYQGRLTDSTKVTVADGAKNMAFAIFDNSAGGTCLWSAANTDANLLTIDCAANVPDGTISITVTDGLFTVLLGDTTGNAQNSLPDTLFNTSSLRYLEVRVNGETLTPRRRLVSSATALQAGNASLLDTFDTSQSGGVAAVVPVTDTSGRLTLTGDPTGVISVLTINPAAAQVTASDLLLKKFLFSLYT